MSIMTDYDDYNIAIYNNDGGPASELDCSEAIGWLKSLLGAKANGWNCNLGMTGMWTNMWHDMAELSVAYPHLMFEVYFVPNRDDRRQWYFSDGKVAEAEEVTAWSPYSKTELRPIFSGGERDN